MRRQDDTADVGRIVLVAGSLSSFVVTTAGEPVHRGSRAAAESVPVLHWAF
jgi:hypothetical protein